MFHFAQVCLHGASLVGVPKVKVSIGGETLKFRTHLQCKPLTPPALWARTDTFLFTTFDEVPSCLSASVQRHQRLKPELSLSSFAFHIAPWNCFDSSSHLLLFIFITVSVHLMEDLQMCRDTLRVITAPLRVAWQVRRPLTSACNRLDKWNERRH